MPLPYRLMILAMLPFLTVAQLFGGRRRLLSRNVEVNDLPSAADEAWADDDFGEHLDRTFVDDRDERVLAALTEIHRTRAHERIDVAIVYGAGHVPGIAKGLVERLGYIPRSGEWLTVLNA